MGLALSGLAFSGPSSNGRYSLTTTSEAILVLDSQTGNVWGVSTARVVNFGGPADWKARPREARDSEVKSIQ